MVGPFPPPGLGGPVLSYPQARGGRSGADRRSARLRSCGRGAAAVPDGCRLGPDITPATSALQEAATAYDHIFLGSTGAIAELRQLGDAGAHYLPAACDPSVHRPMRSRDQYRANVVFAGRASPRREELLSEVVEFGLALWGRGWRKTSLRAYCRGEKLSDRDYVRAYAGASVAVNIHREEGHPTSGCNPRVFELAAMGAAQVVDHREDLDRHFMPGQHMAVFQHPGALKDVVGELLHDPPAAATLGQGARQVALAEHTYMHRMLELLHTLNGVSTPR